jgi:hypothetical protein
MNKMSTYALYAVYSHINLPPTLRGFIGEDPTKVYSATSTGESFSSKQLVEKAMKEDRQRIAINWGNSIGCREVVVYDMQSAVRGFLPSLGEECPYKQCSIHINIRGEDISKEEVEKFDNRYFASMAGRKNWSLNYIEDKLWLSCFLPNDSAVPLQYCMVSAILYLIRKGGVSGLLAERENGSGLGRTALAMDMCNFFTKNPHIGDDYNSTLGIALSLYSIATGKYFPDGDGPTSCGWKVSFQAVMAYVQNVYKVIFPNDEKIYISRFGGRVDDNFWSQFSKLSFLLKGG